MCYDTRRKLTAIGISSNTGWTVDDYGQRANAVSDPNHEERRERQVVRASDPLASGHRGCRGGIGEEHVIGFIRRDNEAHADCDVWNCHLPGQRHRDTPGRRPGRSE